MNVRITWRPVCTLCGASNGSSTTNTTGIPPSYPPRMSGKCPNSPTGKHIPKWEGFQ